LHGLKTSRGFELGAFDASILATAMKKHSSKWSSISLGYVSDVIVLVHRFITTAIRAIVPGNSMAYSLLYIVQDSLQLQYKRAIEQVDYLLQIELSGTPLTTNHYLNDNLEKGIVILRLYDCSLTATDWKIGVKTGYLQPCRNLHSQIAATAAWSNSPTPSALIQ
jgi:hypothetical protein